jgi:hypothetical protein
MRMTGDTFANRDRHHSAVRVDRVTGAVEERVQAGQP